MAVLAKGRNGRSYSIVIICTMYIAPDMTSYMGGLKINVEYEKQVLEVLETSGGAEGSSLAARRGY